MNFFTEPFHYDFMQRALAACLLIGFTNGFLGTFVILRRLTLMAEALSHSLLPGLVVAVMIFGVSAGGMLVGGLFAALFVAVGGHLIASSSRVKSETAIAALYIIAFAVGITLLKFTHVRVSLEHFLFGNILGIGNDDLWVSYAICGITLLCLIALGRPLLLLMFESSVAKTQGVPAGRLSMLLVVLIVLSMVASLQAVGVLLSLGLLILPAATMYLLTDSFGKMCWGGASIGMFGAVAGLLLSYYANVPSGPAIVFVLGLLFAGAYLFSPKYGILARSLRRRHLHEESLKRWKNVD
ncbi:MAG: metal ABC transporter permease [Terrimicrobiaceae bacterium]